MKNLILSGLFIVCSSYVHAARFDIACDFKNIQFANSKLDGILHLSQKVCTRIRVSSILKARKKASSICNKRRTLLGLTSEVKVEPVVYETYISPLTYIGRAWASDCSTDFERIRFRKKNEINFVTYENFLKYFDPNSELALKKVLKVFKRNDYKISLIPNNNNFSVHYGGSEVPRVIDGWCSLLNHNIGFKSHKTGSMYQWFEVRYGDRVYRYNLYDPDFDYENGYWVNKDVKVFEIEENVKGVPSVLLFNTNSENKFKHQGIYLADNYSFSQDRLEGVQSFFSIYVTDHTCNYKLSGY